MPSQRAALVVARAATYGLIVLVLGYAIASLIAQAGTPLPGFAASYVAASAALHVPGAPIYDYATLLRLNAAHQFVSTGFYPFVAPPFALLALAPLALLPYAAASVLWLAIIRLCALGAALALADAFVVLLARRDAKQISRSSRVLAVVRQTSVQLGAWRLPAAPFGLGAALLLLALPPGNAVSWDSTTVIAVLLIALALDAYVRGHSMLAGLAIALASGFSLLPLVLVVCFLFRGAWKAAASLVLFAAAVAAAPLLFLPARTYGDFVAALGVAQGVYGSSDHNGSLLGAASTVLLFLGHMGTHTFIQASKAATLLTLAVVAVTVCAFILTSVLHHLAARTNVLPDGDDLIWLGTAATLCTVLLAVPLAWPDDNAFAVFALLLAGAYPFMRSRSGGATSKLRLGDAGLLLIVVAALVLQLGILPFGLDTATLRLLDRHEVLYLARPVATTLIWAVALAALLAPYPRLLWRMRRRVPVPVPREELIPA